MMMTPHQEEAILKYLAALGPAVVWDEQIFHMITHLQLPRQRHHLVARLTQTTLHPHVHTTPWTSTEERTLCLAMKIYSDTSHLTGHSSNSSNNSNEEEEEDPAGGGRRTTTPPDDTTTNTNRALAWANLHLPHRHVKGVTDKWMRGLDPQYSTRPYTAAQDLRLWELALACHYAKTPPNFAQWAVRHFPDRHAHKLIRRYRLVMDKERRKRRKMQQKDAAVDVQPSGR